MVESTDKGSDVDILERTENLGEELSIDVSAGEYYKFSVDYGPALSSLLEMINKTEIVELSDAELRTLVLQSGSYSFWNDPCEDIYSLEDGEPV
jgi:hypothetical protein